ncbi:acetyl-CoA hydrolase/transferase C-terminal domain-containing protein [soil metagenome]
MHTSRDRELVDVDACIDQIIERVGSRLIVGTPLGIGKPNPLINALYRRVCADPALELTLLTALSLGRPMPRNELERRFLDPFIERHFAGYPELAYLEPLRRDVLPRNIRVSEFYFTSGQMLGSQDAQRHYVSSNYTHVARDMSDAGINVILQLVARREAPDGTRFSLSSNPDLTLDVVDCAEARGARPLVVGQVSRKLPFMHNDAIVMPEFFDLVLDDPALDFPPFAVPRAPIDTTDYAIGLAASPLIRDGGTLQVGIGSLGDAFVYATELRHQQNTVWREVLDGVGILPRADRLVDEIGGRDPFDEGLYGASEMFMDGFMQLYRSGILKRRVSDEEAAHLAEGTSGNGTARGILMHAAFYLGSKDFYAALDELTDEEQQTFCMTRVSKINQLYGHEQRARQQRPHARFINSAMKVTLLGAAVSDALESGQVVSGVGGQYNFVAMAHALPDGRSILMFRSTRGHGRSLESNVVWNYGHTTIPRHLRDIVISEYGIADLRGKTDEECIIAMLAITDSRFQPGLVREAKRAGKLDRGFRIPDAYAENLPETLERRFRRSGLFPPFPYGCDFTDEELVLMRALKRIERRFSSPWGRIAGFARAMTSRETPPAALPYLRRMGLAEPANWRERLLRALLAAHL